MVRCSMSLYLRGKIYWSRIEVNGILHQFSTKQTNRTKAGWAESRKRDELIAGIGLAPTLKDFQDRFLKSLPARVSKQTAKFYQYHLMPLVSFLPLGGCRLDKITPAVIEEFVQWRSKQQGRSGPVAAATVNHNLRTLRRVLHCAVEWEVITRVPKIKLLTGENQREYVLSDKTIETFHKRGTTMGRLVPFLCDTGLRRSEACNLTWAAVNLPLHSIEVLKGKTKYARRRIPLTKRAAKILTEIKERQRIAGIETDYVFTLRTSTEGRDRLSPTWMSHTFLDIRRALGLPDTCVLHSTRHTFCTRLGERGADAFAIQKLAGHSSILISQRYVHAQGPRLNTAIGLLEPQSF
jgi:site-specific recombinase XerD